MEYRIASFNMNRFGAYARKDLRTIAEIITSENLDVVALQEIFSEGKGVKRLLEELVKHELYNWDVCFPDPIQTKDFLSQGETYAYLWNKDKFRILEFTKLGIKERFEPRILTKTDIGVDCSLFARSPFYIRLEPRHGGFFELRLINIHVFYGNQMVPSIAKRQLEYKLLLEEVYPALSTRAYGQNRHPYTIAMGDYNLNLFSPGIGTADKNCYMQPIYRYNDGRRQIAVQTVQRQLSTLKKCDESSEQVEDTIPYANNFDHFTYSPQLSNFALKEVGTIDAVRKYCNGDAEYYRNNISDHLPIIMTIEI